MRVVIAGSRDLGTYRDERGRRVQMPLSDCPWMEQIWEEFDWKDRVTEIVSGKALGIDNLGEQLAEKHGIEVTPFPAEWDRYGNSAGPIRNSDMGEYADVAIVVMLPGGTSGSKNMVTQMKKRKKPVLVYEVVGEEYCRVK